MPLVRRIPKRGFNNKRHSKTFAPVNLASLNQFENGARIDLATLKEAGFAKGRWDGIKILGGGQLEKRLTVCAQAFSAAAKGKIEELGGCCELAAAPPRNRRHGGAINKA